MRTTLSVIKADIGSIGGHLLPSRRLPESVRAHVEGHGHELLLDHWIGSTGDDIAILMTHARGAGAPEVHELAWRAFLAGTEMAREQGLYVDMDPRFRTRAERAHRPEPALAGRG